LRDSSRRIAPSGGVRAPAGPRPSSCRSGSSRTAPPARR
jgi:hypothetical protein